MLVNILPLLKFCSWILVISFINGVRYLFLKKKLNLVYGEYKEEIHKAIRCDKIKFSALILEPQETGNDVLDLLLFKIHRSAKWFIGLLLFYGVSVTFFYLVLRLRQV